MRNLIFGMSVFLTSTAQACDTGLSISEVVGLFGTSDNGVTNARVIDIAFGVFVAKSAVCQGQGGVASAKGLERLVFLPNLIEGLSVKEQEQCFVSYIEQLLLSEADKKAAPKSCPPLSSFALHPPA